MEENLSILTVRFVLILETRLLLIRDLDIRAIMIVLPSMDSSEGKVDIPILISSKEIRLI